MIKTAFLLILLFLLVPFIRNSDLSAQISPESSEKATRQSSGKDNRNISKCLISVESVLSKQKQKQKIILIDVRGKSDFDLFRIPGSLNIPLFALKTKHYLKAKPLILFNEGFRNGVLAKACLRLRQEGFKTIFVMYGGLHFWKYKGGRIEGDLFSVKALNRIPAKDYFEERNTGEQVVIDVSETSNPETMEWMPGAVSMPYLKDNNDFVANIKKVLLDHLNDSFVSVLICNQKGDYPETLKDLLSEAGVGNCFFLEGGLEALKKFRRRQVQMRQGAIQKKTVKECASCP